jgi:hypothetical protein
VTGAAASAGTPGTPGAPGRTPAPPEVVCAWVERYGGVSPQAAGAELAVGGVRALREALRTPPGDREAAWALLAADALFTWAVEEAADAEDPGEVLAAVLDAVVAVECT